MKHLSKKWLSVSIAFVFAFSLLIAGDPIPGIDITIKNLDTKKTFKTKVKKNGKFSFKKLKPGKYTMTLTYKGKSMTIGKKRGEELTVRDAASGMASGKRQHKPLTITKRIDKASPMLAKAVMDDYNSSRSNTSSRAQDYNSSRSNTTSRVETDHNSSRSNKTSSLSKKANHNTTRSNRTQSANKDEGYPVLKLTIKGYEFRGHVTVLK